MHIRWNKKTIISLVLCLGVLFMAVGYSVLSSNLSITGGASITTTWDVRITGITSTVTGMGYNGLSPTYTNDTAKFQAVLTYPGDGMTYKITVENKGTITAILNTLDITESGTSQVIYEVSGIKQGDTIAAGQSIEITVVARYNSNSTEAPDNAVKSLSVGLTWVQYANQSIGAGTYTINYNANGGTGSMSGTTCTVGSNCTLRTNAFTRTGYTFKGWNRETTGAHVYTDGQSVKNLTSSGKTVTLYAVWEKASSSVPTYVATTGTDSLYYQIWNDNTAYYDSVSSVNVSSSDGINFAVPAGKTTLYFSSTSTIYFATSYTYDSSSGTYSLSGTKRASTWSNMSSYYTTYPYTCMSTSSTGTCSDLRKMTGYINSTSGEGAFCLKGVCADKNGQGLYEAFKSPNEKDYATTVYYFRGDNTLNNFVKFGTYPAGTTINGTTYSTAKDIYWRIIRTNEDESIRMIYAGVDPTLTDDDLIGGGYFHLPAAVTNTALKYVDGALQSDIMIALEDWYVDYLLPYHSYIEDAEFCNDLEIYSGTGEGEDYTEYMAYFRLATSNAALLGSSVAPRFACGDPNSALGNEGSLRVSNAANSINYPIGTITADEVVYAGNGELWGGYAPDSNYLHVETDYWTMTPLYFGTATAGAAVAAHSPGLWGGLWEYGASYDSAGYRPVINLKSGVAVTSTSQTGSSSNPYVIKLG